MDTIFMSSENGKTSERHVFILKLNDKLDFKKKVKKMFLYQTLVFNRHGKP